MQTIFVGIASYRDPECQWTVKNLFEKAQHPERVFVGICGQYMRPDDDHCFRITTRPDQIRSVYYNAKESLGVGWARSKAQQLWQGEDYILTIDSHMRFAEGWDDRLIEILAQCGSDKPILSTYPAPYTPPDHLVPCTTQIVARHFCEETKILKFLGVNKTFSAPKRAAFIGIGYMFSSAKLLEQVPWDPWLYFFVESSVAVRAWSHGWDVFSPHHCLAYHQYAREEVNKHWDDNENWLELNYVSVQRMQHLLGINYCDDAKITTGLSDVYGLGSVRTLESFERFAGVDFKKQTISDKARSGEFSTEDRQTYAPFRSMLKPNGVGKKATAMPKENETVCVAFGDHQVAVRSNVPEVLTRLQRTYREMLERESTRTVDRLEVERKDGKYYIQGNGTVCVENESLANTLHDLKHEVARHLMQARPDLLWFHAGAAACQGRATMIAGAWGRGKSTLVTRLYTNGWVYLSDDIVALDLGSGKALPFPLTPAVREDPGRETPVHRLPELPKPEMELKPETVCREAMPVAALIFPHYNRRSPTVISPCSPATAAGELLQNCLNFTSHRETAVRYLCDLVMRVPAFRLSFSSANLGAELIAQVQKTGATKE